MLHLWHVEGLRVGGDGLQREQAQAWVNVCVVVTFALLNGLFSDVAIGLMDVYSRHSRAMVYAPWYSRC